MIRASTGSPRPPPPLRPLVIGQWSLVISCLLAPFAHAAVSLAPLFADGAVLQREKPVPVWGSANAGEKISNTGERVPVRREAFHFSDSGTKRRIKNVSRAGAAPTTITQRHESCEMGNAIPITAMKQ